MESTEGKGGSWRELLGRGNRGVVLVMAGGGFVGAVNIYVAASLLPTAVEDIGGEDLYAWNMTVYLIASVVGTMVVNRLVGRLGNVGAYLTAFAVFAAGSVLATVSPTMPVLLVGRGVQGIAGGVLIGLGFAVVRASLPERLWARGNAVSSGMFAAGNFVGPTIGGAFAQFGSWRFAFGVMALAAVLIGVCVPRALPRSGARGEPTAIPVVSLLLVTVAVGLVSVASLMTRTTLVALGIVAALLVLVGFAARERRARARVLPRSTYQAGTPLKWIYLTIGFLTFGVAVESFVPLFAQRLGGVVPVAAGFLAATISLGWSATQVVSSSAENPRTVRRLRMLGPPLLAVGFLLQGLVLRAESPPWLVIVWAPVLVLAGVGIGLTFPHLAVAAMSSTADPEEGRKASAAIATITTLATSIGTAVGGVLVNLGSSTVLGARYLMFGFAIICAFGTITAVIADRRIGAGATTSSAAGGVPVS